MQAIKNRKYVIIFIINVFNCLNAPGQSKYFPKENWRTANPRSQGLDEKKLEGFISKLRSGDLQRPITSFTIVKNGYLVVNETFGKYDGIEPHTMQSVTKSITSTLVGIAIQQGFINDLDEKVLGFFPEYGQIDNNNDLKRSMDLTNALNMRTGQAWTGESHLEGLNRYKGDKMKYVLDYKMETTPGKKWYYNSGIAVLLGGLLQNTTGMNTTDFAKKYLFEPLKIRSAEWSWSHRGIPHTGGGLYLNPGDMARIGYLYLRNGRWEDEQILPVGWTQQVLTNAVPHVKKFPGNIRSGYGYMWWLLPLEKNGDRPSIYMAYGHWGQFIFVIPEHDMVVTFTNDNSASYYEEIKPISILYDYVLTTVLQ